MMVGCICKGSTTTDVQWKCSDDALKARSLVICTCDQSSIGLIITSVFKARSSIRVGCTSEGRTTSEHSSFVISSIVDTDDRRSLWHPPESGCHFVFTSESVHHSHLPSFMLGEQIIRTLHSEKTNISHFPSKQR